MPLRLTTPQWRLVLRWFVRGMSSAQIARETRLDRKRILRALLVVRRRMRELAPRELALAPEDEDDPLDAPPAARGASRPRMPVLAIYQSHGRFWGHVVSNHDAAAVARAVRERGSEGLELPGLGPYSAIVYRRRLYRLTGPGESGSPAAFGQVEAFWSYLQRQLRAKGGIRRARLNLYLAEYAWRYNHRKLGPDEQVRELMRLVRRPPRGVRNDPFPRPAGTSSGRAVH